MCERSKTCAKRLAWKVFCAKCPVFGKRHPEGTCILLDTSSAGNLVQYFQILYGVTDVYGLKGLHITKYDTTASK